MRIFSLLRKILLFPFIPVYYLLYLADRRMKISRRKKAGPGKTVISVGNITTGGTGKTPLVKELCSLLKKYHPIILTRGYGSKAGPGIITKETSPELAKRFGDEPALLAMETGCDVSVDPNRFQAIRRMAKKNQKKGMFILDDGFQHYALERDLDIVIIDATDDFADGLLLPAGNLREPVSSIRRADIVLINRISLVARSRLDRIIKQVTRQGVPRNRIFHSDMVPDGITTMDGNPFPLTHLKGTSVLAFAGIGNFKSFQAQITLLLPGSKVQFRQYPDHHAYSEDDIRNLLKTGKNRLLLTTLKDGVKLRGRLKCFLVLRTRIRINDLNRFIKYLHFP